MTTQGIGASVRRKEDRRFLLGKGNYTDDITLPNQAYAVFVRSMYAHAKITKIATAAGWPTSIARRRRSSRRR